MPQLSDLADVLVGCRVVSREAWDRAAAGGGDLEQILEALAQSPPPWWDGTGPAPPGLTEHQRWVIQSRFAAGELAALRGDLALNHFLLLDRLGRGGQGEVYRGRQLNPPRYVAIKTLTRDTESGRRRFEQEAKAMLRVRHPAVARFHLYERVRDAAGRPSDVYLIAMELVEGHDLYRLVRRVKPVPWRFAAHWAAELLGGLAEIHRHGFVHRDIKPDNVMIVGPDPGPGVEPEATAAKLLDFGVVRQAGASDGSLGVFVGTREYAPPEQWDGLAVPASDLYALGGTLFYALTGRPPYFRRDRDPQAYRLAHAREPAPDLRERNPDVPEPFDRLYLRMMDKNPAERSTAAELAAEFRALLGRRPEPPPTPPPIPVPAPKTVRIQRLKPAPPPPEPEGGWVYTRVVDPFLAWLERTFIPHHHRPPAGQEPGVGERLAALLRRPAVLLILAGCVALVVLLLVW